MACKELDVALSWLERRLGKPLTQEDVSHKLGLLGFTTSFIGDTMHVTVPSWRSTGDVSIQADIMEEVARMYGYENFEAAPITTSFDGAINQLDKDVYKRQFMESGQLRKLNLCYAGIQSLYWAGFAAIWAFLSVLLLYLSLIHI